MHNTLCTALSDLKCDVLLNDEYVLGNHYGSHWTPIMENINNFQFCGPIERLSY